MSVCKIGKLTTMGPGQGMMANFSTSGPNVLFYIENMWRELVVLPTISFFIQWL